MSFEELVAEVKKLSLEERASLAKWIVESLDELSESEIEALWVQEAERRWMNWSGASNRNPSRGSASPSQGRHLVKPITFHPDADAEITKRPGTTRIVRRASVRIAQRGRTSTWPDLKESGSLPASGKRARRDPSGGFPTTWFTRCTRIGFYCGIRPPEATSLLLAKAAKRYGRTNKPGHAVNRLQGFGYIAIYSPLEVIEHEDEEDL